MSLTEKIAELLPDGMQADMCAFLAIDNATLQDVRKGAVLADAEERLRRRLAPDALFVTIDNADLDRDRDAHLLLQALPHAMEPVTLIYGFTVKAANA